MFSQTRLFFFLSPCHFPIADVFETHVSEDLAVNQCWDVRSDVYFVGFSGVFLSLSLERNWIQLW